MPSARDTLLASGDGVLAQVVESVPLAPVESTGAVFHDLASCLLEQQIHYRSTKRTFERWLEAAGIERLTAENADHFEAAALDAAALSRAKREAFASAVAFFRDDRTNWAAAPEADLRTGLGQIRGVGAWTLDMILLYTLGRPDVFPAGDYHLKKAMASLYGIASGAGQAARMQEAAEAWRPHRSLATRYLLAWKGWQREVLK